MSDNHESLERNFYVQARDKSTDPVQRLLYDYLICQEIGERGFLALHYNNMRRVMIDVPVSRANFVRIMRLFNIQVDEEELNRAVTDQAAVPELAEALEQRKALVNQLRAQMNSN